MESHAISVGAACCAAILVLVLGCLMDFPDWKKRTDYKPSKIKQMKRILISAALAIVVILISLTSCKKTEYKPCKKEISPDSLKKIFRSKLIS